jgi:hypothetical protein
MSIDQAEPVRVRALKTFACEYGYIIRTGEIAHFRASYAAQMRIRGNIEELEPIKAKGIDKAPRNQAIAAPPRIAKPPQGKGREVTPPTLPLPASNSAVTETAGPARRAFASRRGRASTPKM